MLRLQKGLFVFNLLLKRFICWRNQTIDYGPHGHMCIRNGMDRLHDGHHHHNRHQPVLPAVNKLSNYMTLFCERCDDDKSRPFSIYYVSGMFVWCVLRTELWRMQSNAIHTASSIAFFSPSFIVRSIVQAHIVVSFNTMARVNWRWAESISQIHDAVRISIRASWMGAEECPSGGLFYTSSASNEFDQVNSQGMP